MHQTIPTLWLRIYLGGHRFNCPPRKFFRLAEKDGITHKIAAYLDAMEKPYALELVNHFEE